jgi:hypothetical protein
VWDQSDDIYIDGPRGEIIEDIEVELDERGLLVSFKASALSKSRLSPVFYWK